MKKFVTPAVEELKIAETANGCNLPWPEWTVDVIPGNDYELTLIPGQAPTTDEGKGDDLTSTTS